MITDRICFNGEDCQGPVVKELTRFIQCGSGTIAGGLMLYKDFVTVGICELDTAVEVGAQPNENLTVEDARVIFIFDNVKSIDVVIKWFENAKQQFIEQQEKETR